MLSKETIRELAVKWQTTELNVLREYYQHLFLSCLYQIPLSEKLAFKGGTALRIAFGSPRFSEDLDFTANLSNYHLARLFTEAVGRIAQAGIRVATEEDKPTSGGRFSLYRFQGYEQSTSISCNVSLRKKTPLQAVLVTTPLLPSYQCLLMEIEALVSEKIQALLFRKKPRDFFDLYFLLRERRGLPPILKVKERLIAETEKISAKEIQKELKFFLPASHQRLAASLPETLKRELERL